MVWSSIVSSRLFFIFLMLTLVCCFYLHLSWVFCSAPLHFYPLPLDWLFTPWSPNSSQSLVKAGSKYSVLKSFKTTFLFYNLLIIVQNKKHYELENDVCHLNSQSCKNIIWKQWCLQLSLYTIYINIYPWINPLF